MKLLNGPTPDCSPCVNQGHLLDSREGSENEPVASLTCLGWIIYGPCSINNDSKQCFNYYICPCEKLHTAVKEYLLLDSLGIQPAKKAWMSKDDERALEMLQAQTSLKGNKYVTALLWKSKNIRLPESKSMALKRHRCLENKMKREPEMAAALREKIMK